jgi:hypothetical protein
MDNLRGLLIELVWRDQDLTEAMISCANGSFCGTARVYMNPDELPKMAELLDGFPRTAQDDREFQLGPTDLVFAGGAVGLHFHCTDSSGHAAVELKIRADDHVSGGAGTAEFAISIEAAAVDEFVSQLRELKPGTSGHAYLPMKR